MLLHDIYFIIIYTFWFWQNLLPDNNSSQGPGVQDNRQSTFANIWRKCVLMWPYVWPRKNLPLQLLVVSCVVLLAIGRVVNLFLPIYYKKIGEWQIMKCCHLVAAEIIVMLLVILVYSYVSLGFTHLIMPAIFVHHYWDIYISNWKLKSIMQKFFYDG